MWETSPQRSVHFLYEFIIVTWFTLITKTPFIKIYDSSLYLVTDLQLSILQVTQLDLHRYFHALGAGVIEEVRVQRDKGFGFVRYNTHPEAALAIQMGNSQPYLFNRQIKVP